MTLTLNELLGSLSISFLLKDGVLYAPEKIDESVQLPPVDALPDPIRINMAGLRTINSYGTRRLLGLIRGLGSRRFVYLDCPSVFVDTLNIVRDLLGEDQDPRVVQSFSVPLYCDSCSTYSSVLVQHAAVKPGAEGLGLPAQRCAKCGGQSSVDVDPEEYLAFARGR